MRSIPTSWPFCVALSPSVHRHALFYIAAPSIFFFLDFVRGDLALTEFYFLTSTSDFHCFGALGVGPGARTRPPARTWRVGVIIVIVEPPTKCHKSAWPMNYRKYLKTRADRRGLSTLTPQTAI